MCEDEASQGLLNVGVDEPTLPYWDPALLVCRDGIDMNISLSLTRLLVLDRLEIEVIDPGDAYVTLVRGWSKNTMTECVLRRTLFAMSYRLGTIRAN